MKKKPRILILEDFLPDAELAKLEIKRGGLDSIIHNVDNEKDFLNALYTFQPDLIISDYFLHQFDGMEALKLCKKYDPLIPFILFTGSMNEDTAVECMKAGADDYVIKDQTTRLVPAMRSALSKKDILQQKKSAEDALRESELRYRILFNSNPNPMWVYDVETLKFLIVNDEAVHQYGYSRQEFLSMTIKDVRPPDETDEFYEHLKTLRKTIERSAYTRHRKKDGSIIDVEINSHLFEDTDGTKKRLVMVNDVTEKLRTEESLRYERYLMSSLMENTPDHIFFKDINGRYIRINKSMANRFMLKTPEDAAGKSDYDFFPEEIARQILKMDMQVITTGHPLIGFDERDVLPDGREKWFSTTKLPLKDSYGNTIGTFGISRDITKSKQYENELKKLYLAVEQSPASIVITDLEGDIKYVNKTFEDTSGYTMMEVVNKNPKLLKSGHTSTEDYDRMWKTILSGQTWSGEFLNKKKNGELYWESVIITPVLNDQNQIINYLAVKQDITEKKRIVDEVFTAKEIAEKTAKIKSEFLFQISHDIRTQLNTISNCSELVKNEIKNHPEIDPFENFDFANIAIKKIVRTIELINYMSELYSGAYTYKPMEIDLYEIANNAFCAYQIDAKLKDLHFTIQKQCENTVVYADENSLREIVNNLIDNSIKLTSSGKVEIIIRETADNRVEMIVTDTGAGFDVNLLPNLFDPFVKTGGYSQPFDGNVLGLTLVKRYCDINNAELSINSIEGEGTTVSVKLNQLLFILK